MDVFSNNKNRLNTERIKKVDEKSIVFVMLVPLLGEGNDEIEFPYDGTLKRISATCKIPGLSESLLTVQRCEAAHYATPAPNWVDVLPEPIQLHTGEKAKLYELPFEVGVKSGDFFRVYYNTIGETMMNCIVRVDIELKTEN